MDIQEQMERLAKGQKELMEMVKKNNSTTRRQQLEAKLEGAPEKFKTRALRDFDRLRIDSDDDFTSYLADIEQDVADEVQAESDAGLGGDEPTKGFSAGGKNLKDDEVSPTMKGIIADRKAAAENAKAKNPNPW